MAKNDIRYSASLYNIETDTSTLTFAGAPAAGDIVLLVFGQQWDSPSPPSGFTSLDAYAEDPSRVNIFAKLAGGSEPSSYDVTLSDVRVCGGVGYVVEGPFASLDALTLSTRETAGGYADISVLSSAVSLAQAGTAIAITVLSYGATPPTVSSWSNTFTGVSRGGGLAAHIDSAYRVYSSADAAVQTVATFASEVYPSLWLVTVSEASGGGSTADAYADGAILAGSTNVSLVIPLPAQTTDATSGVKVAYTRTGAATQTSTAQSNTATGAHTDWSIVPCDPTHIPALHRVDLPDAAFAAGADAVTLSVSATGMAAQHFTYRLVPPVRLAGLVAATSTTTSVASGLTSYGTNQLARRLLEFTGGDCAGQRVAIVGNTSGGVLEVAPPLTTAPAVDDPYFIH